MAAILLSAGCTDADPAAAPPPVTPATSSSAAAPRGQVEDQTDLIQALRERGVRATVAGTVQQPFLRGRGTALRLTGGELTQPLTVQSYAYDHTVAGGDAAPAVEEDVAQIEPDGDTKTSRIAWVAPPHFYRTGQMIVLYVGDDAAAQRMLAALLGPQFAGR